MQFSLPVQRVIFHPWCVQVCWRDNGSSGRPNDLLGSEKVFCCSAVLLQHHIISFFFREINNLVTVHNLDTVSALDEKLDRQRPCLAVELELHFLMNILNLSIMAGQENNVTGLQQTKLTFLEEGDWFSVLQAFYLYHCFHCSVDREMYYSLYVIVLVV